MAVKWVLNNLEFKLFPFHEVLMSDGRISHVHMKLMKVTFFLEIPGENDLAFGAPNLIIYYYIFII